MKKITIAIDGFSSCGKSTMAKDLAREIGYIYIDSDCTVHGTTIDVNVAYFSGKRPCP